MGRDIRIDSYYSNGNLFLRGRLLSLQRSLWREIRRQPGVLFLTVSPPFHRCFFIYLFIFAAALQPNEGTDYVGIKKKRLDPVAFQRAPNQKKGCLPLKGSCMFRALEIIISRAALWPDLHLIKSSVLISSVPLSFDVKNTPRCFCFCPLELLIE